MKGVWKIAIGVFALVALAAATVGFVSAQTGEGVSVPGGERLNNFIGRLADNLGITQEELEAAIDDTQLELVDEALAEGRITDEQAANARERIESGEGPLFPKPPRRHHRGPGVAMQVAEFIGVTPEELHEAVQGGHSLAQVAEANGVSAEALSAYLLGELQARLAEAVENGRIDQARADEMLANAPARIDEMINHVGPPPGPHGGFRDGFPGGFHGAFPGDGPTGKPEVSETTF